MERLSIGVKMSEAVGKAPGVSLSLYPERSDLEIDAYRACIATLFFGRSSPGGTME